MSLNLTFLEAFFEFNNLQEKTPQIAGWSNNSSAPDIFRFPCSALHVPP
jgi:hypothetical protein